MLLHSGEPRLCRPHTPALPLSEIPEQSGGDVPVHLLPGAGVPPDHHRVPAQRVQGEGVAAGPRGLRPPPPPCACWLHSYLLPLALPGASGSVSRAAWVTVALPSPTSLHHRCPLPCHHPEPPATLALCCALNRPVRAYLPWGSHTGLLQHLTAWVGEVGEDGLLSCSAVWSY